MSRTSADVNVIMTSGDTLNKFVDLAKDSGLVVLGLDGLQLDSAVIVPLLDFIADFSPIEGSLDLASSHERVSSSRRLQWLGPDAGSGSDQPGRS